MEKVEYLEALRREGGKLLDLSRDALPRATASCPGWTVGDALAHVGRAYNWIGEIVETRAQTPLMPRARAHAFDWRDPGVLGWFRASLDRFVETMDRADPEDVVWSWSGDNRVVFWLRLMTHETAIHRWDAQSAIVPPDPIEVSVAVDAIDGAIQWFLPTARMGSTLPDRGETYRFDQTDGPGKWLIRFADETVKPGQGSEDAAVVASGTASDILLFLWRRVPADGLSVSGDLEIMERFARLVPPL
jgi:uncharacterized protein (TIGR03083 family)